MPRRRNLALAAVAGLITVGFLVVMAQVVSDVDVRLAVVLSVLGLLACLAIGAIASQRAATAAPAWPAMAGAALLAFHSLELLEHAAVNAEFAGGAEGGMPILALAVMVQVPGLRDDLLLAAMPAGLLLIVLGCCLRPAGMPEQNLAP